MVVFHSMQTFSILQAHRLPSRENLWYSIAPLERQLRAMRLQLRSSKLMPVDSITIYLIFLGSDCSCPVFSLEQLHYDSNLPSVHNWHLRNRSQNRSQNRSLQKLQLLRMPHLTNPLKLQLHRQLLDKPRALWPTGPLLMTRT